MPFAKNAKATPTYFGSLTGALGGRLRDPANKKFWMLSASAISLAILTWIAAVLVIGNSLGDIFIDDPVREAEMRAQALLISQISMVAFFLFIVLSSWLAGLTWTKSRIVSYAVFLIHGVMILVSFFFMFQS